MPQLVMGLFWVSMQQCEDLEDAESLRHMHAIMRGAIMLNDTALLELLLAEDNVMDTVRACKVTCVDSPVGVAPSHLITRRACLCSVGLWVRMAPVPAPRLSRQGYLPSRCRLFRSPELVRWCPRKLHLLTSCTLGSSCTAAIREAKPLFLLTAIARLTGMNSSTCAPGHGAGAEPLAACAPGQVGALEYDPELPCQQRHP